MKTLKENIVAAMNGNQWIETPALQTNNVKFLLGELAEVLTDMKTYQPVTEVATLWEKVTMWLINEVLERPVSNE